MKSRGIRSLFDRSLLIFLLIGVFNTLVSMAIMQGLYGWGLDYWSSSAIAFTVTSLLSYILNRRYSFQDTQGVGKTFWRFALVIAVCYLLAYSLAQPASRWLIRRLFGENTFSADVIDRVAMLIGQALFTSMNYLGQRFFAFQPGK